MQAPPRSDAPPAARQAVAPPDARKDLLSQEQLHPNMKKGLLQETREPGQGPISIVVMLHEMKKKMTY
jgi:hypothetical protein